MQEMKLPIHTAQQLLNLIQHYDDRDLPTDEDGLQEFINSIADPVSSPTPNDELSSYPYQDADLNIDEIDVSVFDPWFHVSSLDEAHPFVSAWRHVQMISTVTDRAWAVGLQRDTRSVINHLRAAMDRGDLHVDIPRRVHQIYLDALCTTLFKMVSDTSVVIPDHMKEADHRNALQIAELNHAIAALCIREEKSPEPLIAVRTDHTPTSRGIQCT
jgi:hypothetical protein